MEPDYVDALLNVKLPRLTVLKTIVVVNTISDVAGLLSFKDNSAALDGVNSSWFDEEKIREDKQNEGAAQKYGSADSCTGTCDNLRGGIRIAQAEKQRAMR